MQRKARVLVAKAGLDGHQAGIRLVAQTLRDAGMEVIYLGHYNSVEQIVQAAVEEQVDVVGLSSLCGAHKEVVPKVAARLREAGLADVSLIVGGVIPNKDIPLLAEAGVARVFKGGTPLDEISSFVREAAQRRHAALAGAAGRKE
ncbi:MAG: cobalamin B12-binding domain-containing protein [Rubrivivax sp.]